LYQTETHTEIKVIEYRTLLNQITLALITIISFLTNCKQELALKNTQKIKIKQKNKWAVFFLKTVFSNRAAELQTKTTLIHKKGYLRSQHLELQIKQAQRPDTQL